MDYYRRESHVLQEPCLIHHCIQRVHVKEITVRPSPFSGTIYQVIINKEIIATPFAEQGNSPITVVEYHYHLNKRHGNATRWSVSTDYYCSNRCLRHFHNLDNELQ